MIPFTGGIRLAHRSLVLKVEHEMKRDAGELKDRWVHFKIRDVYIPDPQTLLLEVYGDDLLQGRVVDISDSGNPEGAFAVVNVEGIKQQVIVPLQRILGVV